MSETGRSSERPSRGGRKPLFLLLAVAVVIAAWTALWTWGRGRLITEMDLRLARLSQAGVRIVCPERGIGGFPFRMEISCRDPGVELTNAGIGGSVAALRVVAQVWDPRLILVEADGPAVLEGVGRGRLDASWRRLGTSVRVHSGGVDRLSVSIEGLDATTRAADGRTLRLKAEHLEGHGRTSGPEDRDVDVALATAAAALVVDGRPVGPPRADLSAAATLRSLLPAGPGDPLAAFAARGGRIEGIRTSFAVGGASVAGKGEMTLGVDGLLDGTIALAAQGLEGVATQPAAFGAETASLLGGFLLFGKASTDPDLPGRRLDLIVERGRPRLGRLVFPPMAPLFRP